MRLTSLSQVLFEQHLIWLLQHLYLAKHSDGITNMIDKREKGNGFIMPAAM